MYFYFNILHNFETFCGLTRGSGLTQPIHELEVGLKKYYPTANFQPIELSAMSYRLLQAPSHTNSMDISQSTKKYPTYVGFGI